MNDGPDLPRPSKAPCGSCPYRRDVPAGIWDAREYAKLPPYDRDTWAQPPALFFCHQNDGHLCAGWVGCHDTNHLLSMRVHRVHPDTFAYESPVSLFASGAEAAAHGLSGVSAPGKRARAAIEKLARKLPASAAGARRAKTPKSGLVPKGRQSGDAEAARRPNSSPEVTMPNPTQPPEEMSDYKLRMIVAHATGGRSSDIEASVNDICVLISAYRNDVYDAGKARGLEDAAAWHDERYCNTPDAFEMEFHDASRKAIRNLKDQPR